MSLPIHVKIQEGPKENYINGFYNTLGGAKTDNGYINKNGPIQIEIIEYNLLGEVELFLINLDLKKRLILDRTPDNDPNYIHIFIFKEGGITQKYGNQIKQVESGTNNGVFVYDGMFPITVEFPENTEFNLLAFKFRIENGKEIFHESNTILELLFADSKNGLGYHIGLTREIERLIEDIFQFNNLKKGRLPLVISRGIEIFYNLILKLGQLNDEDELAGLRSEDYERLIQIKKKLTSSFDEKISIDALAREFGISNSKLKLNFKQLFSRSIYQFYTHARMDEAYRRLKSGEYSVSEVGYDLGYQNLSKFSEMFKKIKGISPKDVIKANKY